MQKKESRTFFRAIARSFIFVIFLALPALIVANDVRRFQGLLWATSIGLACLFVLSLEGSSRHLRLLCAVMVGVLAFLNVALALSFSVQGTAFNTAFFTHLDVSTFNVALRTDGMRIAGVLLYIFAAPLVAYRVNARVSWPSHWLKKMPPLFKISSLALATLTNYPVISIFHHYIATTQSSQRLLSEIAAVRSLPASDNLSSGGSRRNLILLYLESVEANYLDSALFPGLTPNLNALATQGIHFRDIHQFPGTEWTIGGMVSSQCGVPLLSDSNGNMVLVEADNPFAQITCLPEYLKGAGYTTAFLGGASLDFAGKGAFLRDNGYDIALGIDELPNATGHSWGMFDDDMFAHATKLFDSLVEGGEPFLLSALTLDTHHPFGTPSPSCDGYQVSPVVMLQAVHCTDQLINSFISHIRSSPVGSDTVIAIMSDHLLIMGETKQDLLSKDRRILFIVLDPQRHAEQMAGSATHFDVAPTLLDALGFHDVQFAFGQSLFSHTLGRAFERNLTEADFLPFKIERLTENIGN